MPSTKFAILVGAGASYGSGLAHPFPPPLGRDLYSELAAAFPATWGAVSESLRATFTEDVEAGMSKLWDDQQAAQPLMKELAIYFSRFHPLGNGEDGYARLIKALAGGGLLSRTRIASLNYECLIEYAAWGLGLNVKHFDPDPALGNVVIWKPHGACNFLPDVDFRGGFAIGGLISNYEGPIRVEDPAKVEAEYTGPLGLGLLPAMSIMAPGKRNYYAPRVTQQAMHYWGSWLQRPTCAS